MSDPETVEVVAERVARASRVAVLTGAGVSAESGMATFREPQHGLWSKYDPMELAHIDAFRRDPELVSRWYHWRFSQAAECAPNPGHRALADLERVLTGRGCDFVLATQNIDGLHQQAGSERVLELHGTFLTWRCTETAERVPLDRVDFSSFPVRSASGSLMRPDVVWFGEQLPADVLRRAEEAVRSCDVFMTVGTSGVVWPAAGFCELAASAGAATVEINPEETPVSGAAQFAIRGTSARVLPMLLERIVSMDS